MIFGAALDEDVDLLLLLVLVPERQPEARRDPEVADAGVLHLERDAGHPELEIGREPEVRGLVVHVVLQVEMRVIGHGFDFPPLLDFMS